MMDLFGTIPFLPVLVTLLLLVYWFFVFVVIYHLVRFGIGALPKLSALIFFLGSILFFALVIVAYLGVDFSRIPPWWSIQLNRQQLP